MNTVITLGGLLKFFGITILVIGVVVGLLVWAVNSMSKNWH